MRQKNIQWSAKPIVQKRVIQFALMDLLHGMRHNENLIQQYHNITMHGKVKLDSEVKICNINFQFYNENLNSNLIQ